MKTLPALALAAAFLGLPLCIAHAQSPAESARIYLVRSFLTSVGCPPYDFACESVAQAIARPLPASTSAPFRQPIADVPGLPDYTILANSSHYTVLPSCASSRCTQNIPFGPVAPLSYRASHEPLITSLPTLFTLNALFQETSGDLLSPGKASLGNIIVLYQIFFAHNGLAY